MHFTSGLVLPSSGDVSAHVALAPGKNASTQQVYPMSLLLLTSCSLQLAYNAEISVLEQYAAVLVSRHQYLECGAVQHVGATASILTIAGGDVEVSLWCVIGAARSLLDTMSAGLF
jgi:hypothetical protein